MKNHKTITKVLCILLVLSGTVSILFACGGKAQIPDGEGRYTYLELNENEYVVFAKYENSMVKSADFYDICTYGHVFGLEFEYGSDKRITGAAAYCYVEGEKKDLASDALAEYGEDAGFVRLEIKDDKGERYVLFEASGDGFIDMVKYDDACSVRLDENYLVKEFKRALSEDEEGKLYTVVCSYDQNSRLKSTKKNGKTDLEFVYDEKSCYFDSIKAKKDGGGVYTLVRDDKQNAVEYRYVDKSSEYVGTYRYTDEGVQVISKEVTRGKNHMTTSDYYENGVLKQYVYMEFLEEVEDYNGTYRDTTHTFVYRESGVIERETLLEEYKTHSHRPVMTVETLILYDEKGEKISENTTKTPHI